MCNKEMNHSVINPNIENSLKNIAIILENLDKNSLDKIKLKDEVEALIKLVNNCLSLIDNRISLGFNVLKLQELAKKLKELAKKLKELVVESKKKQKEKLNIKNIMGLQELKNLNEEIERLKGELENLKGELERLKDLEEAVKDLEEAVKDLGEAVKDLEEAGKEAGKDVDLTKALEDLATKIPDAGISQ